MSECLKFTFLCGLRGFHVYKEIWTPVTGEILPCSHERNNVHDRYAIAAKRSFVGRLDSAVVGHLPREISRATRFLILHGGLVKVEVTDPKHRRSPLVQGGIEIPVKVIIEMEHSTRGREILTRYKTHIRDSYKEPIDGKFDDCTREVLKSVTAEDSSDGESDAVENN